MLQLFINKNSYLFIKNQTIFYKNLSNFSLLHHKITHLFATKKKRVVELRSTTISLDDLATQNIQQTQKRVQYLDLKRKLDTIPWQSLPFNELCSLDKQILDTIEIQIKKSKFNISDQEFLSNNSLNKSKLPINTYSDLDRNYKKIYTLLKNANDYYEQYPITESIKKGYLNEMYITDLKRDKQLKDTIARFIKNIHKPQKLELYAEPTFVKYLLSLKRQLMLLGIHFQTKAEKKQITQKQQNIIESNKVEQLPQIKILQILNYEYEFWQDVKHNRAKNGNQDNFIIQTKQINNPNESILFKETYPTIKIQYIVKKKKGKETTRNFCIKADLLIQINKKMKRKIKVEWQGPSNKKTIPQKIKVKNSQDEYQQQEQVQKVNYRVIDYEDIYDGNPTIKPIFYF